MVAIPLKNPKVQSGSAEITEDILFSLITNYPKLNLIDATDCPQVAENVIQALLRPVQEKKHMTLDMRQKLTQPGVEILFKRQNTVDSLAQFCSAHPQLAKVDLLECPHISDITVIKSQFPKIKFTMR